MSSSTSHSPSTYDVRVLSANITCVGSSGDSADVWDLKAVKLVAYIELMVQLSCLATRYRRTRRLSKTSPISSALLDEHVHVVFFSEGEAGSGSSTTTRVSFGSSKKGSPLDQPNSQSPVFNP